ncbi:C40 family peptidase [Arthrobacter sp. HLT1-21]
MSKNRYIARHRATPPSAMQTVSKAVSSHAGSIGRPAAVVVAASGLMLSAGLPANAAGEVDVQAAPASVAQASSAPAPGASTHTVQPGDTLGSIAGTYGVSVESIFAANGLGWDSVIFPGDVISLTGNTGQSSQLAPVAAPAPASAAAPAPAIQVAAPAAPAETSTLGITTASEDIQPIGAASTGGQVSSAGIAGTAQSMIGAPYVYGGTSSTAGWDCSGFVQWVYAQHGIDLPRTSQAQMGALTPTSNPQPGDLVVQNGGGHIGIYIGDGQMVSALNPSQGTLVHAVSAMPLVGYYTL